MSSLSRFDQQIEIAHAQELVGWDFSWLAQHTRSSDLPWDFRQIVLKRMKSVNAMLDTGTGGGEFLASLAPLPADTRATEGYLPNVEIARQRLSRLGVPVIDVSADEDRLPFEDQSFDLVIDRHNGSEVGEVFRVLRSGGIFASQQVGGENCMDLNRFLQEQPVYMYAGVQLASEVRKLEGAGFKILKAEEAFPEWTFLDTAGVVFYLNAIPWQIEDFSVDRYRQGLYQIHQMIEKDGGFVVREHYLLIEAEKHL